MAEQQTLNLQVLGSIPRRPILRQSRPTGLAGFVWINATTKGLKIFDINKNSLNRATARVAELVDALDLGSSPERGGGSSPFSCTSLRLSGSSDSASYAWLRQF